MIRDDEEGDDSDEVHEAAVEAIEVVVRIDDGPLRDESAQPLAEGHGGTDGGTTPHHRVHTAHGYRHTFLLKYLFIKIYLYRVTYNQQDVVFQCSPVDTQL